MINTGTGVVLTPPAIRRVATLLLFGAAAWCATDATAQTFPAAFELSTLLPANGGDGSDGTIFAGTAAGNRTGMSVASAGDINGDGVDDIVIGAFQASPNDNLFSGEAYVVFGPLTAPPAEFDLASLATANGGDGSAGFVLKGVAPGDFTGDEVSGGADLNNDGIDDVVIGAGFADVDTASEAGRTYIIYGSNSGFPAEIELSSLLLVNGGDGSLGSVINGIATTDFSGRVAAGGDFNNDNIDDLLIGAGRADPGGRTRAGKVYVLFGKDGGFGAEFGLFNLQLAGGGNGSAGAVIAGIDAFDEAGTAVANAGDVNGDNIDDIIIGAPRSNGAGLQDFTGEAYVYFGRPTWPAEVELINLLPGFGGDGSEGFVAYGEGGGLFTGNTVGAGDINDDGLNDLFIGASIAEKAYVYFGRSNPPPTLGLSGLTAAQGGTGADGFVVSGSAGGDSLGKVVGGIGDINGDGIEDFAVGAFLTDVDGRNNTGATYLLYGKTTAFSAEFNVTSLLPGNGGDGSAGFAVNGIDSFDGSGIDLAGAGDFNGDNKPDFLIGADTADGNGFDASGEVYIVYGRSSGTEPDGDGDGVADALDNCPNTSNSDQANDDGDALGNVCDNCTLVANDDQLDSNNDGYGNICDADINNDGSINFIDLNLMKASFFSSPASPNWDPDLDLDGSNSVNFADLNLMKNAFFGQPGPSGLVP
ncbi:MAG: hypothetical protein HKN49_13205 [Gammaproteobacteria bacterium]|nr:hypothetical protein [Gammaproteobacteria bacterium]